MEESIIASFIKWCLRKNKAAIKNPKLPIIFVEDTAHCSYLEFNLRQSKERYSIRIKDLTICYDRNVDITILKDKIKDFIIKYLQLKNKITSYKFQPITKACIDLIDDQNIYLNKETQVVIKSIISKTEVIDYNNNTHLLTTLFIRYI